MNTTTIIVDFEKLCRVCMNESVDLANIYEISFYNGFDELKMMSIADTDSDLQLKDLIENVTSIKVN